MIRNKEPDFFMRLMALCFFHIFNVIRNGESCCGFFLGE